MTTLLTDKCPVCTAPLTNSQKWQRTGTSNSNYGTSSLRSTTAGKRNTVAQRFNQSNVTQQQQRLNTSSSIQNVETEYIKQLQEQIYYLEMECLYLRDQLNKNSAIIDHSLDDRHLHQIEQERSEMQRNLVRTSTQFDQLSSEKHGLTVALNELRTKFDVEKQNLLDELDMLKRAKDTFEQDKRSRDQELRLARDRTRASADELKNTQAKVRALEQQLEQQLNQNKTLDDELRHVKLESNNLQRSLTDFQLASREKDRLQDIVAELEREVTTLRQQTKSQETRYNEAQFLRNKLNDEKGALMKEVSRLETLSKEFQRELEQLRLSVRERSDAMQAKDKEISALRKKEQNFRSAVESMQIKLDTESTRGKDLDGQVKQLQRQLNIEIQNVNNAKHETNEFGLQNVRLQDEINILRRDKDHLNSHIDSLQQRLTNEEDLTNSLRSEIEELEERVKEIDRLKELEDLIQSQRWEDISQLANTMQTVSRTMARATSPTLVTRKRLELQ